MIFDGDILIKLTNNGVYLICRNETQKHSRVRKERNDGFGIPIGSSLFVVPYDIRVRRCGAVRLKAENRAATNELQVAGRLEDKDGPRESGRTGECVPEVNTDSRDLYGRGTFRSRH